MEDGMSPIMKTIKAIENFPRPNDLTGVRFFFWLVEQVLYAFSKATDTNPFRELLLSVTFWFWKFLYT